MLQKIYKAAAALVAAVLFSVPCAAAPSISAESAILIDGDTGAVLYAKDDSKRSLIASTTKIMTALVVLERCDLEETVVIPAEATGIEGSSLYLKPGEELTVRELLYGMMLHSGNDAAVALAIACCGNVDAFVKHMNDKAQELNLRDTHFANPNGLDSDENYSTAADLAAMTAYAVQNTRFVEIVSTRTICIGDRSLRNHNRLLWTIEGAIGVKTGYTRAAGRILVSAARRNGRCLIAVTINDGNDWQDHSALYDGGFERYSNRLVFEAGETVCTLDLADGTTAKLLTGEDFSCWLADGEELSVRPLYPQIGISAGESGTRAGLGGIYLNKTLVGTVELLWGGLEESNERTDTKNSIFSRRFLPACRGGNDQAGQGLRQRGSVYPGRYGRAGG